jgi:hypothetical protein
MLAAQNTPQPSLECAVLLKTSCWDLLGDVEPLIMMGNLTDHGTRVMMTSAASGCSQQLLDTIAAYLHNAGWHCRMTDA